jgi:hypothetical protein
MDLPQFGTSHAYSPVMLKQLGTVRNKRNGTDAAHRKFILGDKTEMRIKSLAIILLAIMTGRPRRNRASPPRLHHAQRLTAVRCL